MPPTLSIYRWLLSEFPAATLAQNFYADTKFLYEFPRQAYIDAWEQRNMAEHDQFIARIEAGDRTGAADLMRMVHWSFAYQEDFIRAFYAG